MAFRDFRSPGETWVRTGSGSWVMMKVLETSIVGRNQRSNVNAEK